LADQHLFIKPSTDVYLLLGLISGLLAAGRELPTEYPVKGWAQLKSAIAGVSLAEVSAKTGVAQSDLHALVRTITAASRPVLYGRVGTTVQKHGTLVSFLIEVVNLLTGSLDVRGGAMFAEQAFASPGGARTGPNYNRYQSRVSGYPEVLGQMPAAALAEEIETPGDGQVRALVCFAGNPVVSNPDSDRLERALKGLDFMVCVDIYVNETSRLADVILPGTSVFEEGHYDSFLGAMGWRNVARYSPPTFEASQPREWEIGLTMAYLASHRSVPDTGALQAYEDEVVASAASAYCQDENGALFGRDVQEIVGAIEPPAGVERLLDLGIRAGKWGDHFGARQGLTLQSLADAPDGIDLGEIRAGRLPEVVNTADQCIDLAPQVILDALNALREEAPSAGFQLIGRRSVNTNNSWLHNLPALNKARDVCVLEINPSDAQGLGIHSGDRVMLRSAVAEVLVAAEVTDAVAQGVVCLPHGFSENGDILPQQSKGANYNRLVAAGEIDVPSATAALNGVSVEVLPLAAS
jgi:anaerobic selenocysteine-containing dehydrogenase